MTMYLVATGSRLKAASAHVGVMVGPRVRGLQDVERWVEAGAGQPGLFDLALAG